MLRITPSSSESRAKSYYTTGFAREDYYSEGQEIIGKWTGRAAEMLGLEGQVDRESFYALCENRDPRTGERLTVRTKSLRRVGYDFTFSAVKSVSLVQGVTGDRRIVDAFCESVRETMALIEPEVQVRVRTGGQDFDRFTGNWAGAEFLHFTARPEDGVADPHLHMHCFMFNVTYDDAEQRFKAAQFGQIKHDGSYYEAIFQNKLAQKLMELGYPIVRKGKAFEIAGYGPEVVDAKFGGMIRALKFGAPPHGGIAPGIDRMVMLLCGADNLRDVTMFPLNQQAEDLLMGAPSEVSAKQLRELHIRLNLPKKE